MLVNAIAIDYAPAQLGVSVSNRKTERMEGRAQDVDGPGVEEYTECASNLEPCKKAPIWYLIR